MSSIEYDKSLDFGDSEVVDNDVHAQLRDLHARLNVIETAKRQVEEEKQEMHEKYNAQRAAMQKIVLQKEDELSAMASELLRKDEESTRLMRELENAKSELTVALLVKESEAQEAKENSNVVIMSCNEKMEQSQNEARKLRSMVQTLQDQLSKLKLERDRDGLLSSNVVSATKNLAQMVLKFGPDTEKSAENLEESMKKAKEDADNIRSLVIPLEKQIDDLKEKLSESEKKITKYEGIIGKQKPFISWSPKSSLDTEEVAGSGVSPSRSLGCDMCANYETQLQAQQEQTLRMQREKEVIEANMERFKDDLAKETQFRNEMEEKWSEKKEEQKLQVRQLKTEMLAAQEEVSQLRVAFTSFQSTVRTDIDRLSFDRREMSEKMKALQLENDNLIGKHSKHAENLRNESINFPDTVEELHELLLKLHEDLIEAKVCIETKEEKEKTLNCEIGLLRDQMQREQNERSALNSELGYVRQELERVEKSSAHFHAKVDDLRNDIRGREVEKQHLQEQIASLAAENAKHKLVIGDLKTRVGALQHELTTSEGVQKDFVRLSQSLQIQLEKIRGENTQVRWQHDEDVAECSGCSNVFTSPKQKVHCRHCGQIFCSHCLPHSIPSGPNQRLSRVCQVCHTLLNSESAPYFSQDAPHSPG